MSCLRALTREDVPALLDLYLTAPAADLRQRFCSTIAGSTVREYVEALFDEADEVLGAFEGEVLLGCVEVFLEKNGDAELAILVRRSAQARGLGAALVAAAKSTAQQQGALALLVSTSMDNIRMQRLAQAAGLCRKASHGREWSGSLRLG